MTSTNSASDNRNVTDEFKGLPIEQIVSMLNKRGSSVEVAIENTLRDYNMGTIVRTANAFGIRKIHVVGRRQWNKRGAMMTDKYLSVEYHSSLHSLQEYAQAQQRTIIAIDNVPDAQSITDVPKQSNDILLFGQEGPGLSEAALAVSQRVVAIPQTGSTRSLNVGVAAGIVLFLWTNG